MADHVGTENPHSHVCSFKYLTLHFLLPESIPQMHHNVKKELKIRLTLNENKIHANYYFAGRQKRQPVSGLASLTPCCSLT